jgi:hypothetical protein
MPEEESGLLILGAAAAVTVLVMAIVLTIAVVQRQFRVALLVGLAAVQMVLAVRIQTDADPEPRGMVFLASWLESQLWIRPWLLATGGATLLVALVLLITSRRMRA